MRGWVLAGPQTIRNELDLHSRKPDWICACHSPIKTGVVVKSCRRCHLAAVV